MVGEAKTRYARSATRSRVAPVAVTVGLLAALLTSTPAQAAPICSTSSGVVSATLGAPGDAALYAPGGKIMLYDFDASANVDCGATTTSADRVIVTGSGQADYFQLDFSQDTFEPGLTAEGAGSSEIEVSVALGGGTDIFVMAGGIGDETFTATPGGFRWNGDADTDVTVAGAEVLIADGGAGDDTIDLTATAFATITLNGGAGADTLIGGVAADNIDGGPGVDHLVGNAGKDNLRGGPDHDVLHGGRGNDEYITAWNGQTSGLPVAGLSIDLRHAAIANDGWNASDTVRSIEAVQGTRFGDRITGTGRAEWFEGAGGNDTLRGQGGNDVLLGDEGRDALAGGDGVDFCNGGAGANDTASACEQVAGIP